MPLKHLWLLLIIYAGHLKAEPLSQEQAIQLALERNPSIIAAHQAWEAARARIWPARLLPDPEISLEYEALPEAFRLNRFGERSIGVNQTLEFPARLWLRGRIAQREARVARLEYEAVRIEVTTEVEKACGRVWAGQRRLEYAAENLRLATEFRDRTRVRVEAGDASRAEALRAEVEAGRAEVEQVAAENQLGQARAVLNTLLRQDLSAPIEVSDALDYSPVQVDLEGLRQRALARRPEVQSIQARIEGARDNQSLATFSLLPDFNLWLASQDIRGEGDFWKAGLSLSLPLWVWGKQRAQIAGARAGVARAEAEQVAARNQVLLEVQETYLEVETAQQQVLLFRDRVLPSAEEAYQFVRRRYDEGGANYLEVIDAGRTLTETRTAWVETLLSFHEAVAELKRAVGGRLEE